MNLIPTNIIKNMDLPNIKIATLRNILAVVLITILVVFSPFYLFYIQPAVLEGFFRRKKRKKLMKSITKTIKRITKPKKRRSGSTIRIQKSKPKPRPKPRPRTPSRISRNIDVKKRSSWNTPWTENAVNTLAIGSIGSGSVHPKTIRLGNLNSRLPVTFMSGGKSISISSDKKSQ